MTGSARAGKVKLATGAIAMTVAATTMRDANLRSALEEAVISLAPCFPLALASSCMLLRTNNVPERNLVNSRTTPIDEMTNLNHKSGENYLSDSSLYSG